MLCYNNVLQSSYLLRQVTVRQKKGSKSLYNSQKKFTQLKSIIWAVFSSKKKRSFSVKLLLTWSKTVGFLYSVPSATLLLLHCKTNTTSEDVPSSPHFILQPEADCSSKKNSFQGWIFILCAAGIVYSCIKPHGRRRTNTANTHCTTPLSCVETIHLEAKKVPSVKACFVYYIVHHLHLQK